VPTPSIITLMPAAAARPNVCKTRVLLSASTMGAHPWKIDDAWQFRAAFLSQVFSGTGRPSAQGEFPFYLRVRF
jgi:hypothetical protein